MSLNDRFTAIASTKKAAVRNRNVGSLAQGHVASLANRNLLQQLVRKDKMRAALKLKRRSMRPVATVSYTRANLRANNGIALKRGSVKALRVSANGRPIKTNSMTRVATMKADLVSVHAGRQKLRRSNSVTSIASRFGGLYRPFAGDTSRVANRIGGVPRRGRSRSRSLVRMPVNQSGIPRGRSRSRTRYAGVYGMNLRRGRSRTRSQSRSGVVPIHTRLGARPKNSAPTAGILKRRGVSQSRVRSQPSRRGVAQGRVQNLRVPAAKGSGGGRTGRSRGRVVRGVVRGRSQSRNGRVFGGQRQQQPKWALRSNDGQAMSGRRGRSQQRGGNMQRNGKQATNSGTQLEHQPQQRRGRSRSRGRGGRVGRNQGQNSKNQSLNKEDLDKELDQYMLTTKTENNVDYLLKN